MTRKDWLWLLIGLSALTATGQYVVQGLLASGKSPSVLPGWFWIADYAFWAFRALVEAGVIVYLFSTEAQDATQRKILTVLETALIALIVATVGPALRALGLGQTMAQSLSSIAFWTWNLGLAAYVALMIGSAGYAYRVQPDDHTQEVSEDAQELLAAARDAIAAVEEWRLLSATDRAAWIASTCNGNLPTQSALAEAMGVSPSTVARGYKKARDES